MSAGRYAKGSLAWGECRRSGKKMLLRDMVMDGQIPNLVVAPEWYEPKHPQERLVPVGDPTTLYRPAPEILGDQTVYLTLPLIESVTFQPIPNPFFGFPTQVEPTYQTSQAGVLAVGSLCSSSVTASSPIVMPIPSQAVAGDLLVLAIHAAGTIGVVTAPPGWNLLGLVDGASSSDDYLLRSTGTGAVIMAYRVMQLGDTSVSVAITSTAGQVRYGGCVHAFRNASTARPFPQALVEYQSYTSGSGGDSTITPYIQTPVMNNTASGSKVLVFGFQPGTAAGSIFSSSPYVVVDPYDFLDARENTVSGNTQGLLSLIFSPGQNEFENLLPYTFRNFNNWTKTNITVNDADSTNPVITRTDPQPATGRHGLTQSVNLVSGVTYSLMVHATTDSSSNTDFLCLTVDNGSVEIGATYDKGSNVYIKNGTLAGGGFLREYTKAVGQAGTPSSLNCSICAIFTATVTGAHTIGIGYTTVAGNPVSNMGSSADGGFIWQVILKAGESLSPAWKSLATTGVAVAGVSGVHGRVIHDLGMPSSQAWRMYALEIQPAGPLPDLVSVYQGHGTVIELSADRLTSDDSGPGNSTSSVGFGVTGFVDKWQNSGSGKFYYENTCGALWESPTGGTQTAIGFTTTWARGIYERLGSEAFARDQLGVYTYAKNGQVYADSILVATVDLFTTGDIVGAGINFLTNEITFYKNGLLVYTTSLLAKHRNAPMRAVLNVTETPSVGRNNTLNLTGPMAALPAGFIAYDWERS